MKKIGIIANPNSGKDIRRIFSYAMTIGNNEKANLVERMILGAQDLGVDEFYIMPDNYNMGTNIRGTIQENGDLKSKITILDMVLKGTWQDTIRAAELLDDLKVDCIIVLGGDGTSRLLAKMRTEIPIISVSTGTNNVYPDFIEGTVAGMAAAVVCQFGENEKYIDRDKIIDIYINGSHEDVALVDAAITDNEYIGSRALWDASEIKEIIVTRAHPATIGFSSVLGVNTLCTSRDNFGYRAVLNSGSNLILAPFGAGKMTPVRMEDPVRMEIDQMYVYKADHKGTLALDGERTVVFEDGDTIGFVIRKNGPYRVNVNSALEFAVREKFFSVMAK